MNKSNINEQSAQTKVDSITTAQNQQVSQPNANTNVSSRIIVGCEDCPFCDMLDMSPGYKCNLVDSQIFGYIKESKKTYMPVTPKWCPVKKQPVIVKYGG